MLEQRPLGLNWASVPFRSIEDPAKLRRVLEATLLLEADLELRGATCTTSSKKPAR